jgi:hypothetical protein
LEGRYSPSTVTTLADSGPGSLRDAIAMTPPGGTVDFQQGLTGTIALTSGTLTVDHSLTVAGPGAKTITVSGNQLFTDFDVKAGVTAAISGLTITQQGSGNILTYGGGIRNEGIVTVTACILTQNVTFGGGNYNFPQKGGGGLSNYGTMTVIASTVSNNSVSSPYAHESDGGGIYNDKAGTLTVINSTISGNYTAQYGAGIYTDGSITLISSTVSQNKVNGSFPIPGNGAGIYASQSAGSVILFNTVVAGNVGAFSYDGSPLGGADVAGAVTKADHDLIGKGDGSTGLVNGQNGNQVGTYAMPIDAKLGSLRDNGGPTPTMALFVGSMAIDAGNNAFSPGSTDQRGFPRIVNGVIDIGAYEVQTTSLGKTIFDIGGVPGHVQVRAVIDGGLLADFAPYGAAYTGPITVAVGDVNGDGFPDLVTGAAVGNPDVRVYDGKAFANGTFNPNNPNASMIAQWFPYALQFNVGANVAVGDIEHNGFADIVTGATAGNPDVRVYRGKDIANHNFDPAGASLIAQWFPYGLNFNIGANVAAGDVTGDGFADVVTGPTAGNPDVRVYNGKDIANGTFNPTGASLLAQFFPYGLNFNVGAFVAVGDTTGSGLGDVITGATVGNPEVRVYSGQDIATCKFNNVNPDASLRTAFFAYGLNFNIGAAVASADFEGTGKFDILTGPTAGTPHFRVVKGNATGILPPALFEGIPSELEGGIAVGA